MAEPLRGKDPLCLGALERDDKKWEPVFVKRSRDNKSLEHDDGSSKRHHALVRENSSLSASASSRENDLALRLGLRQIDGLPEHVAALLVAEREARGPFADVAELRARAGIGPAHIERLASADCFGSLGLTRRQALWDARSLVAAPGLPLFAHAAKADNWRDEKGRSAAARCCRACR